VSLVGTPRLYLEDIEVGYEVGTPALTLTEAHVEIYRGVTREFVADGSGAPELLPLCLAIGLGWRAPQPPLAVLAFVSLEWRTMREVRAGDTLHSVARVVSKRTLRDSGVVVEERRIIDQRGEIVQQGTLTFLVSKRPKEGAV